MNISDINTKTRSLCSANSTDLSDATLLIEVNIALEEVVGELIGVNGDFQFDDSNYTTEPIGIGNLVSGQQNYSFDSTLLDILGVSVMDANGKYQTLTPLDQRDFGSGQGNSSGTLNRIGKLDPSQFEATAGMPIYYDKNGSTLYFYPKPITGSVTITNGLKVFFQRTADLFTSAQVTTGTKVPGFMSTYHKILPYMMAIDYCLAYKPKRVAGYQRKIAEIKKAMLARYARRAKDERPSFSIRQESCR